MSREFAIIGDVHGDASRLIQLLESLRNRRLIFVGDYLDRGGETRRTLEHLVELKDRHPETVFLRGNHEASFLAFLDGKLQFYEFAALGGIPTIKAYLSRATSDVRVEFLRVFPASHRHFIESCADFFETSDLIVSHCGINPDTPTSRDALDIVMGTHEQLFSPEFDPPKLVVCGHYAQTSGLPYTRGNFICIDTGCGTLGGPLTALLMPERQFLQV